MAEGTDSSSGNLTLFGISVQNITSATRATWSAEDAVIFQNFAQAIYESNNIRAGRLPPRVEVIRLMEDLNLVPFCGVFNSYGDDLGTILEKKVRHKLQCTWDDLGTSIYVSAAVRTSLAKTRSQTSVYQAQKIAKHRKNDNPIPAAETPHAHKGSKARARKPTLVSTRFTPRTMLSRKPTIDHDNDEEEDYGIEMGDTNHHQRVRTQEATKRRITSVPVLTAAPTPAVLARIRGRARPTDTTSTGTSEIDRSRSKALQQQSSDITQRKPITDPDSDEEHDSRLDEMKMDLDSRWASYL